MQNSILVAMAMCQAQGKVNYSGFIGVRLTVQFLAASAALGFTRCKQMIHVKLIHAYVLLTINPYTVSSCINKCHPASRWPVLIIH